MKLRPKTGHLIFQPLDTLFTMSELFGSTTQKYDAGSGDYIADRSLTPFVLQPHFSVNDKEGRMTNGDYTEELVNCIWTISAKVNKAAPRLGTDYTVDDTTHALTMMFNLDPDTAGYVRFTADFIDPRRGDVLKVHWEKPLSCVSATDWKVSLASEWPMRTDLLPWKDRGTMTIPVQLRNGSSNIPDADSVYQWQIYENNAWRNVDRNRDFWCRGGEKARNLRVEQKYVGRILIRCEAWPKDNTAELQVLAFKLRRFYSLYEDDMDILEGAYIFPETARAVAEAYVVNRKGGRIANPEQYFDIEILYSRGDGHWWHVTHGTRGEVPRSMFPVDSTMKHEFAWLTRELTPLMPFAIGGEILTIGGEALVGQFPIIEREFEE